ncbi:hypothetical protein CERSUDRAFT_112587 [Gelatoporia subvermispora B]|uniref:Uncharacterized protein n=1 Tax=Ceriporiopsis subvermispora (strain B) TaxID=914234 RepID=M2R2V2_CERS8|nr:hypothetical protein CERSUDRAFT_112587 [Gelatoporia subvermispora B]
MDAMDVNWCLVCERHIERSTNGAYCSRECLAYDSKRASTSSSPLRPVNIYPSVDSISELVTFDDDGANDDYYELYNEAETPSLESYSPYTRNVECPSSQSSWIGKGNEGIRSWARNVVPGEPKPDPSTAAMKPPKLLRAQRPIPPSLYMCTTTPTVAESFRPSTTPQQSLLSLSTHSHYDADGTSLPTAPSSVSLATPASEAGSTFPPSLTARPHKPSLVTNLTSRFKAWAASNSHSDFPPRATKPPARSQVSPTVRVSQPAQQRQRQSPSPICIVSGSDSSVVHWNGAPSTYMNEKESLPSPAPPLVRDFQLAPRRL